MITKIFEEVNLENYADDTPVIPSDSATSEYLVPIITGTEFTRNISGSATLSGSLNSAYAAFFLGTGAAEWVFTVTADLKGADVADIPIDAVIHKVRLSYDWALSYDMAANVVGDLAFLRCEKNGGGGVIINISTGLFLLPVAELTPQFSFSNGTASSITLSDSDSGVQIEHEYDFDLSTPLTRIEFLSFFDPAKIVLTANFKASAEQLNPGVFTKNVNINSINFDISAWRMEVDYDEGPPPPDPDIEITSGPSLELGGGQEDEFTGGPSLTLEGSAEVIFNQYLGGPSLTINQDAQGVDTNAITSGPELTLTGTARKVLSVDVSGIYTLTAGLRHDKLYQHIGTEETLDVAIPEPFIKTALLGG